MIEAVNSSLSTSVLTRGSAEQQSVARSLAANPEKVQEIAQAPYVSPYIYMNVNYDKAVLQIRDSDTGDVVRQFPSESQLQAYQKAQDVKRVVAQTGDVSQAVQTENSSSNVVKIESTSSAPVHSAPVEAPSIDVSISAPVSVDA